MYDKINNMTIKESILVAMNELCSFDEPVSQSDILIRMVELTGKSYESCRASTFRSKGVPEVYKLYDKYITTSGVKRVYWLKSNEIGVGFQHNYDKPDGYYYNCEQLNNSDIIITLCGTESNCMSVLDKDKTLTVDNSPHTNPDIRDNIFNINIKNASYNLDFEGILTRRKINYINDLDPDMINLTYRKSKCDTLLNDIDNKYQLINKFEYKSGRDTMVCSLFENTYSI